MFPEVACTKVIYLDAFTLSKLIPIEVAEPTLVVDELIHEVLVPSDDKICPDAPILLEPSYKPPEIFTVFKVETPETESCGVLIVLLLTVTPVPTLSSVRVVIPTEFKFPEKFGAVIIPELIVISLPTSIPVLTLKI